MKKILRLTESDLKQLINKIILEQGYAELVSYNSVVDAPNKTKDEIYDKIKLYLVETYTDIRAVMQLDDKSNGVIILKPTMRFVAAGSYYEGWIDYTLKIQMKDGRFKIEMKDLDHKVTPSSKYHYSMGLLNRNPIFTDKGLSKNSHNNAWRIMKDFTADYFKRLVLSITDFVNTGKQDDFKP